MVSKKTTTTHDHGSGSHVHPVTPAEGSPSRKEKLIIRLERYVQHNLEHAERLERMAEEAERWNGLETARLFRTTEDNIFLQNTTLEKAALLLKNACQAVSHNMQFLYILRNDCITPKIIYICGGK